MINRTKQLLLAALCLCLLLSLCGCGKKAEPVSTPAPVATAEPTPVPTPEPTPPASYELLGREYPREVQELDLIGISDAEAAEAAEVLPNFEKLEKISLGNNQDHPLSWDSISLIHEAAPQAVIDYGFKLYERDFNLSDEVMNLNHIKIEDEGALVKQIAACMTNLTFLDMDSCGVSNESMALIRDSLPNAEVVWRIWFADYYSVRTNVTKILASMPGKAGELVNENAMPLQYCTKVKYLDLGHNNYLETIEFVRSMPDLEVLVVGMTFVEDFSPLEDCPKLEYLEAMTSRIHDLTPLANLKNLKHLNICYNFAVNDISPLFGLTQLERLWIGWHCPVSAEQVAQMQEAVPNCRINTTTLDPTWEGWREENGWYHPRYELLRQQFGYEEWDFAYLWNDPLYYGG